MSQSDIESFHNNGFLKIPGLMDEKYALQIQDEIWNELQLSFGIVKEDSSTWKTPPHSPRNAKSSPTNEKLINDDFRKAIDQLIGKETWLEPASWGGFLITFPTDQSSPWGLGDKLWHWDYELFRENELGGLLIFSFYSEVREKGGGTLIIKGSHKLLREWRCTLNEDQLRMKHGHHRKQIMQIHPYLKKLTGPIDNIAKHNSYFMDNETIYKGIHLQVVELTGNPGDVVFCHPRLIHAPAAVNLSDQPRIMRAKFLWPT